MASHAVPDTQPAAPGCRSGGTKTTERGGSICRAQKELPADSAASARAILLVLSGFLAEVEFFPANCTRTGRVFFHDGVPRLGDTPRL